MFHTKCLLPRLDRLLPVSSCIKYFYQCVWQQYFDMNLILDELLCNVLFVCSDWRGTLQSNQFPSLHLSLCIVATGSEQYMYQSDAVDVGQEKMPWRGSHPGWYSLFVVSQVRCLTWLTVQPIPSFTFISLDCGNGIGAVNVSIGCSGCATTKECRGVGVITRAIGTEGEGDCFPLPPDFDKNRRKIFT